MAFILKKYSLILKRWPVTVQAIQAGALMGVGDVLAQTVVEKRNYNQIDVKRIAQFASVGLVIVGPPLRIWYGILDKLVGSASRFAAVKKMALDQFTFAPFFIVVVMSSIGIAQGQSVSEVKARLNQDYTDVLQTNYKVWPAVQLLNFYLVPLHHQVLTVQIVAVLWNTYLSWKTNTALNTNADKQNTDRIPTQ